VGIFLIVFVRAELRECISNICGEVMSTGFLVTIREAVIKKNNNKKSIIHAKGINSLGI